VTEHPSNRTDESLHARARAAYERRDWERAFELLDTADEQGTLGPEELELLAACARWAGRPDRIVDPLERAHAGHARLGDSEAAIRTALSLCLANSDAGKGGVASTWLTRAGELVRAADDGPSHGSYALFLARARGSEGDVDGQAEAARRALDHAQRHEDKNVEAQAAIELAHVATIRGQRRETLAAIEHAMAIVLGGETGVLETGLVYCNAIWALRRCGEWGRAHEWTDSANRWQHREQVAYFPGLCRVHRAEVLRIRGELAAAEHEATEASSLLAVAIPKFVVVALSELGEIRRRRGDLPGAMDAFRAALEGGWDPQPGLALAVLAQGDPQAAHRGLERMLGNPQPTRLCEDRGNLLAGRVTVAIAAGALDVAEQAVTELEALASASATAWDEATSAQARGELELAQNDARAAVEHLSRARSIWAGLDAPYELATCREILARALVADGDRVGATLELEACASGFERIGANLYKDRARARLGVRPANAQSTSEASLRREGDYWSLTFERRIVRVKHSRGAGYLAHLLANPGQDCWAIDLAGGKRQPGKAADPGDAGEVLDDEARASYRRRLDELREELEEARANHDIGRAEHLTGEMDELGRQLAAAIGLGGRARRAGGAVERARQSVTKAIRGTIKKLGGEHEPLGRYLELAISTGIACRFDPVPRHPVRWRVEFTA